MFVTMNTNGKYNLEAKFLVAYTRLMKCSYLLGFHYYQVTRIHAHTNTCVRTFVIECKLTIIR